MRILIAGSLLLFGCQPAPEAPAEMSLAHCRQILQAQPIELARQPTHIPSAKVGAAVERAIANVNSQVQSTQSECRQRYPELVR